MGNEVEKKQLSNVDIIKFILSLMVVCIHTGVTSLMPAEIGRFFKSIFNLVVPICIQVYFENDWSIQVCLHNYSEGFFKLGQHPYSWQLRYLWSLVFISIILYICELLKYGDKEEIFLCFTLFLFFGKSTSSEVYVNRIMYGNCAGIGYFADGMLGGL